VTPAIEPTRTLPDVDEIVDQRRWIPLRASGLRVLHLGCVDEHLTEQRAGTGALLHEELAKVTSSLTGVDISESGLETMERLVPGVYLLGDIEALDQLDLPEVDLVIAAEVIEHLGSPGRFLTGLRDYLDGTSAVALITTPNAFGWRAMTSFAFWRRETVHPDHRLLYSPVTLVRTIELAGLEVRSMRVHTWRAERRGARQVVVSLIDAALLKWNPWLGVGLVFEVGVASV
jgi:predicted TPR repeat methyltransferase